MQLALATTLREPGQCFMFAHTSLSPEARPIIQPASKGLLCLRSRRHRNKSLRQGRTRSARRSDGSPEGSFQEELLCATRRFQALEEYRQLLQRGPAEIDLFQAAMLIAKHRHPLLPESSSNMNLQDETQSRNEMNQIVEAVQASLPSTSEQPGFELVYITRHLGQIAGFKGNDKDYYNPDNSCINMVLQQHTGIPITLGLLYMAVAQRLGLHLHGLNLPGRFMLGNNVEGVTNLLVDPFDGFKLCSLTDVEEMFAQGYNYKLTLSTALVTRSQLVMSTPTVLVRILSNLKNIYTGLQQADKVLQITDYLRATRDVAEDIRDAGLCLFSVQRYADSAELLQQYLEHNPSALDRPQTEAVLNRIYKLLQKPSL